MCLSKRVIKVAIYGASATGKTVITSELVRLLSRCDVTVRHCGDIVKDKAKSLGLDSPSTLALAVHKEIDDETKKVVLGLSSSIVVEGRYLNFVITDSEKILFFRLSCSFDERVSRLKVKLSLSQDKIKKIIWSSDEEDRQLIHELYGNSKPVIKHLITLDTTGRTISQSANSIFEAIKNYYDETG